VFRECLTCAIGGQGFGGAGAREALQEELVDRYGFDSCFPFNLMGEERVWMRMGKAGSGRVHSMSKLKFWTLGLSKIQTDQN
jgi:hypothetical protein